MVNWRSLTAAPADLKISRTREGVAFWIHVSPRARRCAVGPGHGDALRVAVVEAPVSGAANAACVRALAEALGIARDAVELEPASRGRRKRVRIRGDARVLERRLCELAAGKAAD